MGNEQFVGDALVATLVAAITVSALFSGKAQAFSKGRNVVSRTERPTLYWTIILSRVAIAFAILMVGINTAGHQ